MNITDHEIRELIRLVESKLGRPLAAPVDFSLLSLEVEKTLNETISISTIKRLVGYVNDEHKPSVTTLNLLARYVGYPNFPECTDVFCGAAGFGFVFYGGVADTIIFLGNLCWFGVRFYNVAVNVIGLVVQRLENCGRIEWR